jgi:hypothetical protein
MLPMLHLFIFFVILKLFLSKAKRYLYCHRRSNYQEGEFESWDLINRLSRHTFAPVPSQDWNLINRLSRHTFVPVPSQDWNLINRLSRHTFSPVPSQDWISNVIFRGLVYGQRVELRGDCTFCWYLCNCWPLLFKLSFHKNIIVTSQNCLIGYLAEKRSKKGPNRDNEQFYLPIGKQTHF